MRLDQGSIYSRENNLNLIRLLAAISVTFGHSFAMTHGSHYQFLGSINSAAFGFYAVAIFFGLSGFLITQSFFRRPQWQAFLKARLLRLVPGLLFSNLITALIIIFIVKASWDLLLTKNFLIHIFGGSYLEKYSFPDTFSHLHYNSTNGSLWTLPYEFEMYMVVLFLGLTKLLNRRILLISLFAFLFCLALFKIDFLFFPLFKLIRAATYDPTYLSLPLSFGLGILAYVFKDKIKLFFIPALIVLIFSLFTDWWLLKLVAWLYFIFCFGYLPKLYMKKLNFHSDISYGIYILSWPIQQTVLHLQLTDNPYLLFLYSIMIVIPLALTSWILIEKPSLRFK